MCNYSVKKYVFSCAAGLMLFLALTGACKKKKDVAVGSRVIDERAPSFTLENLDGDKISLKDYLGDHIVLAWINLECP